MLTMNLRSVTGADVRGKRVLLRADLNEPIAQDGTVAGEFRLRRALKTLEFLAKKGARIIVVSHLGRQGGTLYPVFQKWQSMTAVPMRLYDGPVSRAQAEVERLSEGQALVLENIRREAGEERNDPMLSQELAHLADLYVNDAFAVSHRVHASIVGVPKFLPAYAGLLIEEEILRLSEALTPPRDSTAVIGGAKFETKEPLIARLLTLYDRVYVGGALANDFLKAKGYSVGVSLVSQSAPAKDLLSNSKIVVPGDVLLRDGRSVLVGDVGPQEQIVDVGEGTVNTWSNAIAHSKFVLWNGPLGIYEQGFVQGTDALAQALASSGVRAAVGGGDTLAALEKFPFDDARVFRSTGGGAMLQFLACGTLPGLEPLRA